MVMASQFESFLGPLVIMFSIPFAFTGVALGNMLHGLAVGVMSLIGIIILLGIVVKNGIVLIDYTILCQERGMSVRDSSVTAARSRLRPILMTTLTTVCGMLPLAWGRGEGSEMWNGLGVTVAWGLSIGVGPGRRLRNVERTRCHRGLGSFHLHPHHPRHHSGSLLRYHRAPGAPQGPPRSEGI